MSTDTLETLTGESWPEPGAGATSLEQRATAARRVPIGELTAEHLRLLLGQGIDLDTLLPIAVDRLVEDPMASGDYYPGDALEAALAVPPSTWAAHPRERDRLQAVIRRLRDDPEVDVELGTLIDRFLADA